MCVCRYIQLHKYTCHVSQVWLVSCLKIWSQYSSMSYLLHYNFTFDRHWSRITQLSNSYCDVIFKSLNTLLIEVMISSKNKCVFICVLSDLALHIIFDGWWGSMDVGWKHLFAWNDSRHAPSWRFYLHCGSEETGSSAIICIIYHQVLCHLSEHGTSSMVKHSLAKVYIAKLNKLTESEVRKLTSSTVDETVLAIPKRQGSCGIPIVCSQRKFTFDF